jgi:arginase
MRTQIIQVPYDSGHKNYRMGLGPGHIVRHLKSEHFPLTEVSEVEVLDGFALEIGTSFAVARQLAEKVCDVASRGAFPLVLGQRAPPPCVQHSCQSCAQCP